jgi:DNA-binding transcriptional ArsR family regulator
VGLRGLPRVGLSPNSPQALDQLFAVLADPTRRTLLQQLVHEGPATATRLAEHYPVSRQAVVKHLQALAEADLVVTERSGREMYYRATPERLADAAAWLIDTSAKWDRRLERLRERALRN